MGITQTCSTDHKLRNICNARNNVLVCAWIAVAQITILLCFPVTFWHFCSATIHIPKITSENVIPMLGGKRTSKTRQKNDRPNKQRKVQKWKNHLEIFRKPDFIAFPLGRGQTSWNVHPHRGPEAKQKANAMQHGNHNSCFFSTPLMRKHHFGKWCVARMCV